jgi:hypothetical protein
MEKDVLWAKKLHDRILTEYTENYRDLMELRNRIASLSIDELSDVSFFLKKSGETLDDLRVEVERIGKLSQKIACLLWVKAGSTVGRSIRGKHSVGTPDIKVSPVVPNPNKDPTEFAALVTELFEKEKLGCIRVHWPALQEYVTELAAEGKPQLKGVTNTFHEYRLTLRKAKGSNA